MTRVEQLRGWRPAVSWLVQAVREVSNDGTTLRRRPPPPRVSEAELAAAASFHGVQGFARLATDPASPFLENASHAAAARHLRSLADLAVVDEAFRAAGIEYVVVKGPVLVRTSYTGSQLRSYVDLDLLVRPRDLGPAVRALERAHCRLLDANWPLLTANGVHELRLEGPTGGAIDLHWSLSGGSGDEDTAPAAEVLLGRAVELTGTAPTLRALGPADHLVHVAVHAASSGGHRLVWLADLRGTAAYTMAHASPDEILAVAKEWSAVPALALMAGRTRHILGADLPAELLTAVPAGAWKLLVSASERMSPPQLAGQGSSLSRLVARACRATPRQSLAAATRKGGAWVRLGAPTPPGAELMHDPTNPASALYPSGGPEAAEEFFERVAHGRDG